MRNIAILLLSISDAYDGYASIPGKYLVESWPWLLKLPVGEGILEKSCVDFFVARDPSSGSGGNLKSAVKEISIYSSVSSTT